MNSNEQTFYKFPFKEYSSEKELPDTDRKLISKAREAGQKAYAQYSRFNVGAAVLLENGVIITGSNQENAAYPSGLCAERVALFYAASQHPNIPVKSLVVTAIRDKTPIDQPVPPCGSCRQVFVEWEKRFGQPFEVIMAGTKKIIKIRQAGWLLPFNFQAEYL